MSARTDATEAKKHADAANTAYHGGIKAAARLDAMAAYNTAKAYRNRRPDGRQHQG